MTAGSAPMVLVMAFVAAISNNECVWALVVAVGDFVTLCALAPLPIEVTVLYRWVFHAFSLIVPVRAAVIVLDREAGLSGFIAAHLDPFFHHLIAPFLKSLFFRFRFGFSPACGLASWE
jgi:hypothetical protein